MRIYSWKMKKTIKLTFDSLKGGLPSEASKILRNLNGVTIRKNMFSLLRGLSMILGLEVLRLTKAESKAAGTFLQSLRTTLALESEKEQAQCASQLLLKM